MLPNSKEEYLARFHVNQGAEGFGLDTASVFPCPFCAAPRWAVAKIVEVEAVLQKSHHCGECGRAARMIVDRNQAGLSFEIVQTGGDDQPEWLEPKMRREGDQT